MVLWAGHWGPPLKHHPPPQPGPGHPAASYSPPPAARRGGEEEEEERRRRKRGVVRHIRASFMICTHVRMYVRVKKQTNTHTLAPTHRQMHTHAHAIHTFLSLHFFPERSQKSDST